MLYASGEESARQIKLRANRLGVTTEQLYLLSETRLSDILGAVESVNPDILIVDSIQTLYNEENTSSPGSISQVKDCTMSLMHLSKTNGGSIFLVTSGHTPTVNAYACDISIRHLNSTGAVFVVSAGGYVDASSGTAVAK